MKQTELTSDEFYERYDPLPGPDDSDVWQADEIAGHDPRHIWTVYDAGSGDGLWVAAGQHRVNRVGYVVTRVAWTTGEEHAVFMDAEEAAR